MKTKVLLNSLVLVALIVSMLGATAVADPPPLEDQIEDSVVLGLGWLATQQNGGGYFGEEECERVARTGLAILKFEDRAIDLGYDPLDPDYEYSDVVQAGLDYIENEALTQGIGIEPAGDPDGDGDGLGVYWDAGCGPWHQIYNTGIAMMALAASGHPELYGDLLQDAVDYMAWAQVDENCGVHRGGWRYGPDECDSDNSNSGYAALGLGYAQSPPPLGFSLTVPQFVKDELSIWVDVIQDDVNGDADDGGSYYDPSTQSWVNILKTGNLIHEMGLAGDDSSVQRVQDAVDYIERHWNDAGGCDIGWQDHRQAMFTMMKGLESMGIDLIDLDNDGIPEYDWFAEVAQHLIDTQDPTDGFWPAECWGGQILSTTWALLTLEKAVPVFEIPVPVDIHPTSCPNPISTKSKGVTPVAILGTEDFDVTQIDPVTVRLVNLVDPDDPNLHVAPLRWALEDVATPYEPFLDKPMDIYACTEEGPDGYMDMTLKFDTKELVAAMGEVNDGDALKLTLTGNLLEEFGGTPIVGEDVVKILKKGK